MPANWRSIDRFIASSAVVVAAFGFAPFAHADASGGGTAPNFMMEWWASNDGLDPNLYNPLTYQHEGVEFGFGTWTLGSQTGGPGGPLREVTGWRYRGGNSHLNTWSLDWDCVVNPDPFIDANINVTNLSNTVQTFWINMPLPIAPPIIGGAITSGSLSIGLTGNDFTNAQLSANGAFPIYRAEIDGNPWMSMADPGYQLDAMGPFGANSDNMSFSNLIYGPDVMSSLMLRIRFDLSPGDSASITAIFTVEPIPGPAALSIFALLAVAGGRRRRVS